MRIGRTRRKKLFIKLIIILPIVAVAGFFGVKYILEHREVPREYELIYDEALTESELDFLKSALKTEKGEPEKTALPVKIAAKTVAEKTDLTFSELVPVTDWYSLETSVSAENAVAFDIFENLQGLKTYGLTAPANLNGKVKLLAIGDDYYLDNPEKGAVYRVFEIALASKDDGLSAETAKIFEQHAQDQKYQSATNSDLESLKTKLREKLPTLGTSKDKILTFAQTGVTALSRAMVTKLNQVGSGAYFAENIKDFLSSKDLTHISNEVSFADNCPGGSDTVVLCSDWRMLDTITAIGTDIVELTGNHNNDYGTQANLNTIAKYEELGLKTFGGGKNEESAREPLQIEQKGAKITLLGYNQSTTTAAYGGANGSTPGANLYSEAVAKQQIAEAKERGDFVIVDIQYYECYCYPDGHVEMPACDSANNPAGEQAFFRHIADLGADLVIGTQAHQPQTYELYNGTPIFYGTGNLFFDQVYWPGTTRGLVFTHYFLNGKYAQTVITPTVYDSTFQTRLMDATSARNFLQRLLNSSPRGE